MRLESVESGRTKKKLKRARIEGFSLEYNGKKNGKITKPTLFIDSPDVKIPPLKLTPELAAALNEMMSAYLEDLKAAEWHEGYRVHADWEDPQMVDDRIFDDDDW